MQGKKPCSGGETYILPNAVKTGEIMNGKGFGDMQKCMPLPANVSGRCLGSAPGDQKKDEAQMMGCRRRAVQLGESTNVAGLLWWHLLVSASTANCLKKDSGGPVKERPVGEDWFSTVNDFFNKTVFHRKTLSVKLLVEWLL